MSGSKDVELFKKVVAELEKRKGDKSACEGSWIREDCIRCWGNWGIR